MASLFSDNFNSYTPDNLLSSTNTQPSTSGTWTQQGTLFGGGLYSACSTITATGSGNSWWLDNAYINKLYLPNSTNTIYASFWTRSKDAFPARTSPFAEWYVLDGGSVQVCFAWCSDTVLRVYRGDPNGSGTLIASFPVACTGQTWEKWEIKVVIDASAGSVEVRKNGATSNTFSATGLNTKNTSNAYINGTGFNSIYSDYNYLVFIDEFQLWDSSGSSPNTWSVASSTYSVSVGETATITATPAVSSTSSSGSGSGSGASTWSGSCSALDPGVYGVMRLYADGRLVATRTLTKSGEQWRLPSGFKAQFWQIEFEARAKIYSVEMATSAKELAGV